MQGYLWKEVIFRPYYQKTEQEIIKFVKSMANHQTNIAGKTIRSLIIAAVVFMTLPSCKHGVCEAYQGSSRSTHKHKRKSVQVIQRTNNPVSKIA